MSVREIVEYAQGRLPTKSKTPDTVVARDLSMDIKRKGEKSLFCRTAPGRYTMREFVERATVGESAPPPPTASGVVAPAIPSQPKGPLPARATTNSDVAEASSSAAPR